jgi:hypothetical protein
MGSVCGYLAHSLRPWNRRYGEMQYFSTDTTHVYINIQLTLIFSNSVDSNLHSNGTVKNGNQDYVCKFPMKQKKKYNLVAAKSILLHFFVKLYVPVFGITECMS